MLLIDDILLAPITGFQFVMRTLARVAEEQYTDDASIEAHRESAHFKKYAAEGVYTMIESRDVGLYDPI